MSCSRDSERATQNGNKKKGTKIFHFWIILVIIINTLLFMSFKICLMKKKQNNIYIEVNSEVSSVVLIRIVCV